MVEQHVLLESIELELDLLQLLEIEWLGIIENLILSLKCHLQIHQQLLRQIRDMVPVLQEITDQLQQVHQLLVQQAHIMMH